MDGLAATLSDLPVLVTQDPVHRGLRAQVAALIEQDRIHLTRRQIDETLLMQHRQHLGALRRGQGPWLRLRLLDRFCRCRGLSVPPVVGCAGTTHRGARVLDAHHRGQFGDGFVDHCSLFFLLLLVARDSNRAESFDWTSITWRALSRSSLSRWFSLRSRATSRWAGSAGGAPEGFPSA